MLEVWITKKNLDRDFYRGMFWYVGVFFMPSTHLTVVDLLRPVWAIFAINPSLSGDLKGQAGVQQPARSRLPHACADKENLSAVFCFLVGFCLT